MKYKNIHTEAIKISVNGQIRILAPNEEIEGNDFLSRVKYLMRVDDMSMTNSVPRPRQPNIPVNKTITNTVLGKKENNEVKIKDTKSENYNPKKFPLVSIVILTKNKLEYIKPCIDSILKQVNYPNYEIIVGDTGSTEKNVLDYYITLTRYSKIHVVRLEKYHFGKNYNELVKNHTSKDSEFIICLNNDTILHNDIVSIMFPYININKIQMVGCTLVMPQKGKDKAQEQTHLKLYNDVTKKYDAWPGEHFNKLESGIVEGVTGACFMMKKSDYLSYNGFDETYEESFQDCDLCCKITLNGYKIYFAKEARVFHYHSGTRDGHFPQSDIEYYRKKWCNLSPKISKPVFSIICCCYLDDNFIGLHKSILQCKNIQASYEIIKIDNRNNSFSLPIGLNRCIDVAEGKYIIEAHEDVRFPDNWNILFNEQILKAERMTNSKMGVLGMFGANEKMSFTNIYNQDTISCQTIDECLMIFDKELGIKFDERNPSHVHGYGVDICLQFIEKGYFNFVMNFNIKHLGSGAALLNSQAKEQDYLSYIKFLKNKWIHKFPIIRSTNGCIRQRVIGKLFCLSNKNVIID